MDAEHASERQGTAELTWFCCQSLCMLYFVRKMYVMLVVFMYCVGGMTPG